MSTRGLRGSGPAAGRLRALWRAASWRGSPARRSGLRRPAWRLFGHRGGVDLRDGGEHAHAPAAARAAQSVHPEDTLQEFCPQGAPAGYLGRRTAATVLCDGAGRDPRGSVGAEVGRRQARGRRRSSSDSESFGAGSLSPSLRFACSSSLVDPSATAAGPAAPASDGSTGGGTTRSLPLAPGASRPWYPTWCARGDGISGARRSSRLRSRAALRHRRADSSRPRVRTGAEALRCGPRRLARPGRRAAASAGPLPGPSRCATGSRPPPASRAAGRLPPSGRRHHHTADGLRRAASHAAPCRPKRSSMPRSGASPTSSTSLPKGGAARRSGRPWSRRSAGARPCARSWRGFAADPRRSSRRAAR